jgi:mono/diheme cytochrome c family protein
VRGHVIFARECVRCHTLTGHEHNTAGGDLAVGQLPAWAIASFARIMPTTRPLSPAASREVAAYIVSVAQKQRQR